MADTNDAEIKVTSLYVFNELQKHTRECSARWWTVMAFVIANLLLMVGGMTSIIVMLAMRSH